MPAKKITVTMRNNVIAALERYAEGGPMSKIRDELNLRGGDFYRVLREEPELKEIHHQIQQDRADMMVDEAYQIGTDDAKDPRVARVQAEIRMKIAAAYDRKRFGDKINVEMDAGPNLAAALEAAKSRVALPGCDLANAIDVEVLALPASDASRATDKQSDAQPTKVPSSDPLGIFGDD